ncbi:MAG TPA: YicC family protein [Beijerinckiaceae bacterium]|nr:YicC family protein [Beijerinckiaceae bacterium]
MSIRSMTGFARAQGTGAGFSWTFEAKSVNGRGLDARFRLPAGFDMLEPDMRSRTQKALTRGNVNVTLTVRRDASSTGVRINETLFAHLAEAAERLAWTAKLPSMTAGDILRLPGVIESGDAAEEGPPESVIAAVLTSFDAVLADLVLSRRSEGAALERIIAGQIDGIETGIGTAEAADSRRSDAIRSRLETQIAALLGTADRFDPDRLHQEAMLIAARIDVKEEIDRLKAHVAAARALLASGEAVGRKLDFLAQEFVREANTLCSKANDIALTRAGLDLKTWVEQFREQVQNIE